MIRFSEVAVDSGGEGDVIVDVVSGSKGVEDNEDVL